MMNGNPWLRLVTNDVRSPHSSRIGNVRLRGHVRTQAKSGITAELNRWPNTGYENAA